VNIKTTVDVSLTATFAALYAVCVVALAPISFQVFQVRVADALLPLAILFGWPAILGFSGGAFISNFFGGLGFVDIVGGSLANFLATYVAWKIGRRNIRGAWLVATASEILLVAVIVGSYLSYLFQMPLEVGLLGIFLGSLVATGILGSVLLLLISRPIITQQLESRGLTIYRRQNRN
jgi:uncharacterized membrane protein